MKEYERIYEDGEKMVGWSAHGKPAEKQAEWWSAFAVKLWREREKLRKDMLDAADRIAKQSELLSKKAEHDNPSH